MINRTSFDERFSYFDKEVVVEIIDIFIEEYDARMKKITELMIDQNLVEFKKAVHAFKGVMANFEENCLAYQKIVLIHHEAVALLTETEKGLVLTDDDLHLFFNRMLKEFEVFKPTSFELLNDLKTIRNDYL